MFNSTIDSDAAADAATVHRNAYNAAFYELGLRWYWDSEMYPAVLSEADERRCSCQLGVAAAWRRRLLSARARLETTDFRLALSPVHVAIVGQRNWKC